MSAVERLAAWVWDNLPGGTPTQLWVWGAAPQLADWCELQANRRDARVRYVPCTVDTSCTVEQHTYSWPCDYAPGSGRYARGRETS